MKKIIVLTWLLASCEYHKITPDVFDWAIPLCKLNGGIHEMECVEVLGNRFDGTGAYTMEEGPMSRLQEPEYSQINHDT